MVKLPNALALPYTVEASLNVGMMRIGAFGTGTLNSSTVPDTVKLSTVKATTTAGLDGGGGGVTTVVSIGGTTVVSTTVVSGVGGAGGVGHADRSNAATKKFPYLNMNFSLFSPDRIDRVLVEEHLVV